MVDRSFHNQSEKLIYCTQVDFEARQGKLNFKIAFGMQIKKFKLKALTDLSSKYMMLYKKVVFI